MKKKPEPNKVKFVVSLAFFKELEEPAQQALAYILSDDALLLLAILEYVKKEPISYMQIAYKFFLCVTDTKNKLAEMAKCGYPLELTKDTAFAPNSKPLEIIMNHPVVKDLVANG